ncbi:type IV secretory system conjugative DNA transfer family protein [Streptomyces sp. BI20]|uniref:type IV secretory system conjugative DNA transfer family protein n=1 Tax=Streptomyces sp. BI20 TaxID=3403460 RepID=UPI003C75A4E9
MRTVIDPYDYGYELGRAVRPKAGPVWARADQSARVIGPMGSGKTMRVFGPLIRRWPGPVVATSTKPDLVELTLDARRADDRPVVAFDPQGIAPSLPRLRWSPITGAADTRIALARAKALVAGSRTPGSVGASSEGGAFYRGQAAKVLACFLHAAALDRTPLGTVLRWARKLTDPVPVSILATHPGAGPGWAEVLRTATSGDSRTVGNMAATLDAALEPLMHADVVAALEGDGGPPTDLAALLAAGGTIYILGKDSEVDSITPLTTAITEDIFDAAEGCALLSPAGRLDPPLLGALDEVANIAPIPSLRQRVADGRGRGITIVYGLQAWASAVARFGPDTAAELAAFTNIVLVLGGAKDPGWLREISDLCGQVERVRTSRTKGGGQGGDSVSRQTVWEPVLRPDEIKGLATGRALVLAGNLPPIITKIEGMWTWETWPAIEKEITVLRAANDTVRARTDAVRRRAAAAHAAAWKAGRGRGAA